MIPASFDGLAGERARFAATLAFLGLLFLIDALLILVHVLHVWSPWLNSRWYSIELDGGLAEQFQYIKQIWLATCLGIAFLMTRGWAFAGWSLFFGVLLVDDMLQLHERLGDGVGLALGIPPMFGLRTDDYGEIAVAALLGVCALSLVWITLRRGGVQARQLSSDLMCLLVALALFAVFFDMLHTITYFRAPAIAPVFALIEDGGEMLVVSVIAAYAFDILANAGVLRIGVWSWARRKMGTVPIS